MELGDSRTHEYADDHGRHRDRQPQRRADELGEPERDEDEEQRERRHDERQREHDGARVRAEDEPPAAQESLPFSGTINKIERRH